MLKFFRRFFGGFGGFGQREQEETTPRGEDVRVRLEATMQDVYVGRHVTIDRVKSTYQTAPGKRQCNCRMKMHTKQIGPGMYQQFQKQVCYR
jgi:DnaJ family protein B protein 11